MRPTSISPTNFIEALIKENDWSLLDEELTFNDADLLYKPTVEGTLINKLLV